MYRHGDVGIFNGENLVHAGTPAAYVPEVMANLFSWLSETTIHPLVASCVFHYELEFIHPFQDGNGRTGRLWQTLILSEWNELFAWLPVESLVKEHQEEYYASLGVADVNADSTAFVQFMLSMISAALDEVVESQQHDGINDGINNGITDNNSSKSEEMREQLLSLVRTSPTITIAQMADELGVGKRQAERLVASLKAEGRLVRLGAKRNGRWEAR